MATFAWKVVKVYELPAEQMLETPDVGIVPWIPLMHHDGPPEPLLRRCRERIDREGGDVRNNLLAVAQSFLSLKFQQAELFELFGGDKVMVETPLVNRLVAEGIRRHAQEMIADMVLTRHGKLSGEARARLQGVQNDNTLQTLHRFAGVCPSLEAFVERLNQITTPPPAPVSSRRKRKS